MPRKSKNYWRATVRGFQRPNKSLTWADDQLRPRRIVLRATACGASPLRLMESKCEPLDHTTYLGSRRRRERKPGRLVEDADDHAHADARALRLVHLDEQPVLVARCRRATVLRGGVGAIGHRPSPSPRSAAPATLSFTFRECGSAISPTFWSSRAIIINVRRPPRASRDPFYIVP